MYDENKGCVTISVTKPACDRLQSGKLIEIWVVVAFETSKKNTNVDRISIEKNIS
jgi:hypothetical protein